MKMATSTFDRPLVLEKDEDIQRFWEVMNLEPKPLYIDRDIEEGMRRCERLLENIPLR